MAAAGSGTVPERRLSSVLALETHWEMGQDGHRVPVAEDLAPAHRRHRAHGHWRRRAGVRRRRRPRLLLVEKNRSVLCVRLVFGVWFVCFFKAGPIPSKKTLKKRKKPINHRPTPSPPSPNSLPEDLSAVPTARPTSALTREASLDARPPGTATAAAAAAAEEEEEEEGNHRHYYLFILYREDRGWRSGGGGIPQLQVARIPSRPHPRPPQERSRIT